MFYEYKNSFHKIEKILDPEIFGSILGAGSQSLVITPYSEFNVSNIENPVLIISLEKEKFDFLDLLFANSSAKVEKVNKSLLSDDYKYVVKLLESEGFSLFYCSKLESVSTDDLIIEDEPFDYISDKFEQEVFSPKSVNSTEVDFILESSFTEALEYMSSKVTLENSAVSKYQALSENLITAMKESLEAVKKLDPKDSFIFDFHNEQFMQYNGKVMCVDPVLFNSEYITG